MMATTLGLESASKTQDELVLTHEVVGHDFDRDPALERELFGLVDRAHRPFAEHFAEFVAVEPKARGQLFAVFLALRFLGRLLVLAVGDRGSAHRRCGSAGGAGLRYALRDRSRFGQGPWRRKRGVVSLDDELVTAPTAADLLAGDVDGHVVLGVANGAVLDDLSCHPQLLVSETRPSATAFTW